MGRVGCRTEWTFCPTKPGTYTWGVQTINAAYNGSTFTEGPQFTVTEEDISDGIADVKSEKLKVKNHIYSIAGQRLLKEQKGVNIVNKRKMLY